MKIIEYTKSLENTWNAFLNSSKTPLFMFNRSFMEYHQDRFHDKSLLFYKDKKVIAILPANIYNNILISHGGLTYGGLIINESTKLIDVVLCIQSLKHWAKDNNIKSIIFKTIPHIFHKTPSEELLYALFLENATLLKIEPSSVINLSNPLKYSKGRKYQLSKSKRYNLKFVESEDFSSFIDLENEILKKYHNTKAIHTALELQNLKKRFPENIMLYCAYLEKELIAGTVLFVYDSVVHTQYLAANEKAREIGGLDFVIHECIEKYKNSKLFFDFGISTEENGRILNQGLVSQKEGFGARTIPYITWKLDFI